MKLWKAALGVGAACAACCAVPLLGGAAALTIGSASMAATGSALLAYADEFAPLAFVLLALASVGGGLIFWRRHQQRAEPPHRVAQDHEMQNPACALPIGATQDAEQKACGCAPGACR
ncbi:hypothetical protein ACVC7V_12350 [Hydrogenophaga sp. A37]|uniref:hypothetical protein n=1 Tax=Hydrogenophaga sp. A37 TaxID=1945864 RepID=UPI00117AA150|nr:hypothetical protein [Hydrogenophaga sp. A37]